MSGRRRESGPSGSALGPPLPLAAARERLRGKPGRPRKHGHTSGTAVSQGRVDGGPDGGALAHTVTGHKTHKIFDRYHIVSPGDLQEVARKLTGTISGTVGRIPLESAR